MKLTAQQRGCVGRTSYYLDSLKEALSFVASKHFNDMMWPRVLIEDQWLAVKRAPFGGWAEVKLPNGETQRVERTEAS